jgi:hypothetical protein
VLEVLINACQEPISAAIRIDIDQARKRTFMKVIVMVSQSLSCLDVLSANRKLASNRPARSSNLRIAHLRPFDIPTFHRITTGSLDRRMM